MSDQEGTPSMMTFDVHPAADEATMPMSMLAPLALDGFAHGIDPLDGLVVFALGDGAIHGAWIRSDAGFSAQDVAASMREAYRSGMYAARKLATFGAAASERASAGAMLTIETPAMTVLLDRIRAFVVACVFDSSIPLGMARLIAAQLCSQLEPELPLTELERITLPPASELGPPPPMSRPTANARRSVPVKAPHASPAEVERARRLIAHAEANLPDPHTVRLRLALRAHTSRLSLDHPEALPSDAVLRIETAVLEMLGIERDQLSAIVADSGRS